MQMNDNSNHYRCPRCSAASGTLNLLTSMTRYFVCGRCQCRWQVARVEESDSQAGAQAAGSE
jgi:hypothetical protein